MVRFFLVLMLFAPLSLGCSRAKDPWAEARPGQKRVLASFPPLFSMTAAVAGDDAYVLSLLSTQGPHDFHDSPSDMLKLYRADLIVMNGLGLDDSFMKRLINGVMNRKARVVEAGEAIPENDRRAGEKHKHADGTEHDHGRYDPHVWLGPPEAKLMVQKIAGALAEIDPAHKAGYDQRAAAFVQELDKLHEDGNALLAGKKNRRIVTMHESLGYFARAFNLQVKGAIQVQPGDDPDAPGLAKLTEVCKDVGCIAVEPQYDAKLARTLQKHLELAGYKVNLVDIDPLETAPLAAGSANPEPGYYLRKMRENIENLARALP